MIFGYARVSTKGQAANGNSLDVQLKELKKAGAEEIYTDTFTGTWQPHLSGSCSVFFLKRSYPQGANN